ncbi:MAG TPA: sorbosone dehydrogenase family protein, partial [Terriglobia bacterium]|nr:sorbosone dehydrogenase family protein [Terriglobia bacterium]
QRLDLVNKTIIPDVLLQPHAAALQFIFYTGDKFPEKYRHGAFIAEHGSWNRSRRSGYQVVFVPFHDGKPSGNPMPFLEGFVPNPTGKDVYGRPVGVAELKDGSILVSDDGGKVIWRIAYGQ